MKIEKAKYVVEFTEEEKKAILTVINMTDTLYEKDICDDNGCTNCPFYDGFCISRAISDDERIKVFIDKLEKFVNEE